MVRLLAFALGAAALTAETAWVPLVASIVGADGLAVQAVLGAFFSGTAVGAWTLGRRAERRVEGGAAPLREFAQLLAAASVGLLVSLLAAAAGRTLFRRPRGARASTSYRRSLSFSATWRGRALRSGANVGVGVSWAPE